MTDLTPATVAVPVTLIHRAAVALAGQADDGARADLLALLPKPTPRLVAVDLYKAPLGRVQEWVDDLATQPDLLTLLDEAIDGTRYLPNVCADFKSRIRAALGVTA